MKLTELVLPISGVDVSVHVVLLPNHPTITVPILLFVEPSVTQ